MTFFIAVAAEQAGQRRRMAVSGRAEFRITLTPPLRQLLILKSPIYAYEWNRLWTTSI